MRVNYPSLNAIHFRFSVLKFNASEHIEIFGRFCLGSQMMRLFCCINIVFCCVCFWSATAEGQHSPPTTSSSQDRPCGSSTGRFTRLIPQGWRGADFKPTCVNHDTCYDTPGSNRAHCDQVFRMSLLASCEQSRRPRQCQRVANLMFKAVDRFGHKSFDRAQRLARR